MFLGRRMNSISSSLCHDLLSRTSWLKTESRWVIQRSVQKKSSAEDRRKTSQKEFQLYCAGGDSAGVSSAPAAESGLPAGASVAAGLVTSVVAGGGVVGVGLVAGATVSVFCSHAARSAKLASIQMYFFIIGDAYCFNRSIAASAVFGPRRSS